MMAIKKKKKKEEFDASLMGGYLPGAKTPVAANPVISSHVPQTIADIPQITRDKPVTVTYLQMAPGEVLNYKLQSIGTAFWYYAIGSGPSQFAIQTPQAYGAYRLGLYPTFRVALAMELGVATAVFATLGTILDPHRVWRAPYTSSLDPFPTTEQARLREPDIWNPGMAPGEWIRAGSTT